MTHSYGLITLKDAETLERTLTLTCMAFPTGTIRTCELGVHRGKTAKGIHQYITHIRGRKHYHAGVDNCKDLDVVKPFDDCTLLLGDSVECAALIADESQHFLFIDADHSYNAVVRDFAEYSNKVVKGGYLAFHDTSPNIPLFKDYQKGDPDDPLSYIAVRASVEKMGLFNSPDWNVIFDEYDSVSDTGGMIVIKKMY